MQGINTYVLTSTQLTTNQPTNLDISQQNTAEQHGVVPITRSGILVTLEGVVTGEENRTYIRVQTQQGGKEGLTSHGIYVPTVELGIQHLWEKYLHICMYRYIPDYTLQTNCLIWSRLSEDGCVCGTEAGLVRVHCTLIIECNSILHTYLCVGMT